MIEQTSKKIPPAPASAKEKSSYLFLISAPSGAGKTTLCRIVLETFADIHYSISYTTRARRRGETDGVDYHFITKDDFETGIENNKWAEWAEVHGNYYGTSAAFLDEGLAQGRDILLDIDVAGTRQILKRYPQCITIFIMPPSLEILRQRLESRGTDSADVIAVRLKNAKKEMAQKSLYRHVIVNDKLSDAIKELTALIEHYRNLPINRAD